MNRFLFSGRRLVGVLVAIASASLALVACGSDASDTPAGGAGSAGSSAASTLTYREYQTRQLEAACERNVRCDEAPKSVEECLAAYDVPETQQQIDVFEKGVDEGRIAFDSAAADVALDAYATFACDRGIDVLTANNRVLTGLVEETDRCFAHVECAKVDDTLSGRRYCVSGCDFLTGVTGAEGTCQQSPISTGVCPSK
jgi:hypothetical protein